MDTDVRQQIDWLDWLRRWDAQQEGYVPDREARFTAMFDALAALMPASFVTLELACPGIDQPAAACPLPPRPRDRGEKPRGDWGSTAGPRRKRPERGTTTAAVRSSRAT